MTNQEFIILFNSIIEKSGNFDIIYDLVILYRDNGGEKKFVIDVLTNLGTTNELFYDEVADLLDIIVGYCHPKNHIWPE